MYECNSCGNEIEQVRVEAFIEFRGRVPDTCINCSTERQNLVFMVPAGAKGTAMEPVIINSQNPENVRQARNANERKR